MCFLLYLSNCSIAALLLLFCKPFCIPPIQSYIVSALDRLMTFLHNKLNI
nr:MAG TPA: hypothetical protein [Caudoviricetes sp.]